MVIIVSFKESHNKSFLNTNNHPLILLLLDVLIFICWKMVIPLENSVQG